MNKLVYIDEEQSQRNAMKTAAILSGHFGQEEIITLEPHNSLDEMIAEINEHQPTALITDFRLNEYRAGISYNGTELVSKYLNLRKNFPCFVTTGYASDAADAGMDMVDINSIFSKEDFNPTYAPENPLQPLPFFLRVKHKIQAYQNTLERSETELEELQEKVKNNTITPKETQRMFDLDGELEAMLGNVERIPSHIKEMALEPISRIIRDAEALVSKLEGIHGQKHEKE